MKPGGWPYLERSSRRTVTAEIPLVEPPKPPILVRPLVRADLEAQRAWPEGEGEIWEYYQGWYLAHPAAGIDALLEQIMTETVGSAPTLHFAAVHEDLGLIGRAALVSINDPIDEAGVWVFVRPDLWHRGFGTKIMLEVLHHAFDVPVRTETNAISSPDFSPVS